jgi:hypothetical protein
MLADQRRARAQDDCRRDHPRNGCAVGFGLSRSANLPDWRRGCHGAHYGEGPVLAILAMLARKGALRVAPGGSAPPISSVALRGLGVARSGRESRLADRTGKLDRQCRRLGDSVAFTVGRDDAYQHPVAGLPGTTVESSGGTVGGSAQLVRAGSRVGARPRLCRVWRRRWSRFFSGADPEKAAPRTAPAAPGVRSTKPRNPPSSADGTKRAPISARLRTLDRSLGPEECDIFLR